MTKVKHCQNSNVVKFRSRGFRHIIVLSTLLCTSLLVQAVPRASNVVNQLTVEDSEVQTTVRISTAQSPTFTVFNLKDPSRVFIDISNAKLNGVSENTQVRNGVLRSVTFSTVNDANIEIVRVMLELEVDALYSVKAMGDDIVVGIDNSDRIEQTLVVDSKATIEAKVQAEVRARDAERRAQTAEKRARDTEIALQKARAKASENAKIVGELRLETETLKRLQDERLQAASRRIVAAEQRVDRMKNELSVRVAKAKRQAEEAYQRADKAETNATKKVAEAEANARTEEAKAMTAAAQAAERSQRLESRAVSAEKRAQEAESELLATKGRLNSLSKEVSAKAAADLSKASAEVERLRVEADLIKRQASAAEKAAKQKIAVYEVRAREAELRAQESLAAHRQNRKTEEELADTQRQLNQLAKSARGAEKQAQDALGELKEVRGQLESLRAERERDQEKAQEALSQAEKLAQAAEQTALNRASEAEERLKRAERALKAARTRGAQEIAKAKADAIRMEAELKRAEARAQSAKTRTAEAERRALEAASKTRGLNARFEIAQKRVESLQSELASAQNREAVKLAQAQANIESVALEKAELAEKLRRAELEQAKSKARIEALVVETKNAALKTESARIATERQQTAALNAEKRARDAELKIEKSRLAQLELQRRTATLESELATARAESARLSEYDAAGQASDAELQSAVAKIQRLENELKSQTMASREAQQSVAASQDALNRAKQDALDAQTLLAQANEKARKAELRAAQEAQRAETAEAKASASLEQARLATEQAENAEAAATANLAKARRAEEKAESAEAKVLESLEKARLAEQRAEDARRETERAREETAQAEKRREEALNELSASEQRVQTAEQKLNKRVLSKTASESAGDASPELPPAPQFRIARVTDIGFSNDGVNSIVRVESTEPLMWSVRSAGLATQTLVLANAEILPLLERTLDTSDFGENVNLVSSFQAPSATNEVHVVVTLNRGMDATVVQNENVLEWKFPRTEAVPNLVSSLPPPAWQGPVRSIDANGTRVAPYTGMNQIASSTRRTGPRGKKRYRGRKINVDIKDGDIHNVLRVLAKTGNVNIVTSDEVSGTVTMHLKLVPWDQALDMVLRTKGLDMVREGDIIRVAPSEMIAQEREAELKKQEVKERLKPLEIKMITVNHANAEELIPRIKSVLSKRGSAEFDTRTNTVIVKDVDDHLDAAEDMIRRLDTQTPQVLIETRIVEVNEVNVKQLGIQWGMDSVWSAATGNPTGLRFPSSIGISGGADDQQTITEGVSSNPNFVVNLPASAGGGSGGALGLSFGSIDSTFNLNVRLSALENRGSVKIVSSPKITTLDNKKARISQGVSIPISQVSATGVQTVFFDAVLALEVQPHVTQDGNIYLNLKAENNTPDFQNVAARGDPTILKKEASTELLLRDGDTTVIGGIYTSNAGVNSSEVPFFGSIPILGALFRNHQQSDRRTELLIFVTPRIVNRAASTVRTVR